MIAHLHVHSHYSFLNGLAAPDQLVESAVRSGMPALALTDHNYLSGALEFYDACRGQGVRPILGIEINTLPPNGMPGSASTGKLVLLAQNLTGWTSLCRLSSLLLSSPDDTRSVLAFADLAKNTDGLLCLTGGCSGVLTDALRNNQNSKVAFWLEHLKELFSNRLYLELQLHAPSDLQWVHPLVVMAAEYGLPCVATHSIMYLRPDQAALQKIASAIRVNQPYHTLASHQVAPADAYFLAPDELRERFRDFPDAIKMIGEVVERSELELPLGITRFPQVDAENGQTPIQVLRMKASSGAEKLYGKITQEIQNRLDHELSVIDALGYAPLFLVVEDVLGYARRSGVPISSRGSAASSLVAHCLGITSPDPLRLNLYFERFLNPARATPPDIDTDLCSRRRERVIRYVYERYGVQRVATVCTINRFRSRSALREVAKAYGLSTEQVSKLAENLPHRWYGPPSRSDKKTDPFTEIRERYPSEPYPSIFRDAAAMIGIPHHLSVHPGGVVIAPGNLNDVVPTQMAAKGVTITQFDMDGIERLGLVKIDLLGIRGLTVIGDVAESIHTSHPSSARNGSILDILDSIPEDDLLTADAIRNGRTIGCFQIESPGMRATLKEVQADSVDDIMAALALYRPGPLTGGLKDAFVRRYRGEEPTQHLHPSLAPLLEDTYGVILYQEQVLRIAHELAGLSLADADLLRRAMSHFDPGKQMQSLKERFLDGVFRREGIPAATGEQIWDLMAAFAGYGFPKAHAASYAQIAWRAAWCKVHFPAVFMAAVLANWGGYYSQRVYLMESRRLGLELHPPEVNFARREFSFSDENGKSLLYMGLDQVRELTRRTIDRIQRFRPFTTFNDFLARTDPRPSEAENLVRCGALEEFGSIPQLLHRLESGGWQGGQMSMFSMEERGFEDWSLEQRAASQEAILGVSIVAHPLELKANKIAVSGAMNTVDAAARLGQRVRVAGMRQTWRRTSTARGDYIYFMALEDLDGMLDVVIYGDVYRRWRGELEGSGPFVIEGIIEFDNERNEPFLRAERIWKI